MFISKKQINKIEREFFFSIELTLGEILENVEEDNTMFKLE